MEYEYEGRGRDELSGLQGVWTYVRDMSSLDSFLNVGGKDNGRPFSDMSDSSNGIL